jgi:hypothetical protein
MPGSPVNGVRAALVRDGEGMQLVLEAGGSQPPGEDAGQAATTSQGKAEPLWAGGTEAAAAAAAAQDSAGDDNAESGVQGKGGASPPACLDQPEGQAAPAGLATEGPGSQDNIQQHACEMSPPDNASSVRAEEPDDNRYGDRNCEYEYEQGGDPDAYDEVHLDRFLQYAKESAQVANRELLPDNRTKGQQATNMKIQDAALDLPLPAQAQDTRIQTLIAGAEQAKAAAPQRRVRNETKREPSVQPEKIVQDRLARENFESKSGLKGKKLQVPPGTMLRRRPISARPDPLGDALVGESNSCPVPISSLTDVSAPECA